MNNKKFSFPFPRLMIINIIAFVIISGIICIIGFTRARAIGIEIGVIKELRRNPNVPTHIYASTDTHKLKNEMIIEFITAVGGLCFILASLYFLYLSLKKEYCFQILGEHFSFQSNICSGDSLTIGPIRGLEEKALLVGVSCNLPKEVLPKVGPFRFYKKPLPRPKVHYVLELVGLDMGEEDSIATAEISQKQGKSWEEDREYDYNKQHNVELPISAQQEYSQYYLHIKVGADIKGSTMSEVTDSITPVRLRIKLTIGLQAQKIFNYQEPSFAEAIARDLLKE